MFVFSKNFGSCPLINTYIKGTSSGGCTGSLFFYWRSSLPANREFVLIFLPHLTSQNFTGPGHTDCTIVSSLLSPMLFMPSSCQGASHHFACSGLSRASAWGSSASHYTCRRAPPHFCFPFAYSTASPYSLPPSVSTVGLLKSACAALWERY